MGRRRTSGTSRASVSLTITTGAVDRQSDVIDPAGIEFGPYMANPVVLCGPCGARRMVAVECPIRPRPIGAQRGLVEGLVKKHLIDEPWTGEPERLPIRGESAGYSEGDC